jgi:hypothetical protein
LGSPHSHGDPVPQQQVGLPHRVFEEFLLIPEIVENHSLGRAGMGCDLFKRRAADTLALKDNHSGPPQFSSSNVT